MLVLLYYSLKMFKAIVYCERCQTTKAYCICTLDERLYATTSVLSDGSVFVYGGRKSPRATVNCIILLKFDNQMIFSCSVVESDMQTCQRPPSRWRHTAAVVTIDKSGT